MSDESEPTTEPSTSELPTTVVDGGPVSPAQMPAALTAAEFVFDDGATQVFTADGETTYVEHGRQTSGTWYVDGDRFCSFWPPSYTGCYDVVWVADGSQPAGLTFIEQGSGRRFIGRYRSA